MGVAGSGKSTVGRLLAHDLGWDYFEADDFHPPENVAKMSRAEPLNDEDRAPWLAAIRGRMEQCLAEGKPGIFTCSALKQAYRDTLTAGLPGVALVQLHGDTATIATRVGERQGHFMRPALVRSQFEALEPPRDALTFDVRLTPQQIVAGIRQRLSLG